MARRQEREDEYRHSVERRIANEPDLTAQIHILTQAVRTRPNDEHLHRQRQQVQARLQQVSEVVERAKATNPPPALTTHWKSGFAWAIFTLPIQRCASSWPA